MHAVAVLLIHVRIRAPDDEFLNIGGAFVGGQNHSRDAAVGPAEYAVSTVLQFLYCRKTILLRVQMVIR